MPERGFTLLEIMLVIFLIGLASAGVVQTFATDSESPAKKAAQDFLTRFAQFKDRAVIEGQTLGVLIDPPGYQFMQRRQGQWLPVSATRLSAQVTVPKQVQMLLQPGSDIWQKEYALELQRRRLTLHDIELELQKEAKRRRRRSVFRLLNRHAVYAALLLGGAKRMLGGKTGARWRVIPQSM